MKRKGEDLSNNNNNNKRAHNNNNNNNNEVNAEKKSSEQFLKRLESLEALLKVTQKSLMTLRNPTIDTVDEIFDVKSQKEIYDNIPEVGKNMTVSDILIKRNIIDDEKDRTVIAAKLMNEIVSLRSTPSRITVALALQKKGIKSAILPVYLASPEGLGVYRSTLCFVLCMAANEVFPDRKALRVEHGFGVESSRWSRAYYCEYPELKSKFRSLPHVDPTHSPHTPTSVTGDDWVLSDNDVTKIEHAMNRIVSNDLPITEIVESRRTALAYFEESGQVFQASYLRSRNIGYVQLAQCGSFITLSHSNRGRVLAPSTGYVKVFKLTRHGRGLILNLPSRADYNEPIPTKVELKAFEPRKEIAQTYEHTNKWGSYLNLESLGSINERVAKGKARELVQQCEALQDSRIFEGASRIYNARDHVQLVLIAGPSSAGKTTFANKLKVQLSVFGFRPLRFSTDDYYINNDDPNYPRTPEGELDFESIDALDLPLLHQHLRALLNGEEINAPIYDFHTRMRSNATRTVQLEENGLLIMEGIFCLNPRLTEGIDPKHCFKLYISPLSQLNLDEMHFMSNQIILLIRRIARDFWHRSRSASNTLKRWQIVLRGEERNIYPFTNNVDFVANTALDYEIGALKVYVEPLLENVKPDDPMHTSAMQILGILHMFHCIPGHLVPSTSLLQEFVGISAYEDD